MARTAQARDATARKPGDTLADKLARLGIDREADLVVHLPLRYEDLTRLVPLAEVRVGDTVQTEGAVAQVDIAYRPRRQLVARIEEAGEGGRAGLALRFFTFWPSTQKALERGARVRVYGDVREGYFGPEIVHPQFKVLRGDEALPDRLTPVYPTTAGLSQDVLRKAVARALAADPARLAETLPEDVVRRRKLWKFGDAVSFLHAPPPRLSALTRQALDARTHPAWTRLKFDELVAQQLALKAHRAARATRTASVLTGTGVLQKQLLERVGFTLTRAQARVVREIAHDLKRSMPMQRLLQGDVGSGKTVVAALAALQAIESGRQVAFMAPTEILAEQHYRKLAAWLDGLPVEVAWLSGSLPAKERRRAQERLASGDAQFAVGTHALFQAGVEMPRLALAIVDEQHRFGVAQRLALRGKGLAEAHQLMMSATPIPRTLAMTHYADLDVSVLDELPPGRTPVATRLASQKRRAEIVAHVGKRVAEGAQCYWVCPIIEESEKLELQTAVALHAELTAAYGGAARPAEAGPTGGAARPAEAGLAGGAARSAEAGLAGGAARSAEAGLAGGAARPAEAGLAGGAARPAEAGLAGGAARPAEAGPTGEAARSAEAGPTVGSAGPGKIEVGATGAAPVGPASAGRIAVGLLHGRMKPAEKAATMAAFVRGDIQVLVATTVIEVGVDVPNASIMVIEHAERFGLAQLHQLRGRVGRGAKESQCILLFEEPLSDTAKQRLKVIYESHDGFEIARADLAIRGPGEFLGARQSGVPMLRFADLERDGALIEQAREAADEILAKHPAAAAAHLERWLGGRQAFFKA